MVESDVTVCDNQRKTACKIEVKCLLCTFLSCFTFVIDYCWYPNEEIKAGSQSHDGIVTTEMNLGLFSWDVRALTYSCIPDIQ